MSPSEYEAIVMAVIFAGGGGVIIAGVLIFVGHRRPWALRNRRRPRLPRQ